MTKIDENVDRLEAATDWDEMLKSESRLPGPRANLELMEAFARIAEADRILRYVQLDASAAPENTPDGFLAVCGTRALARLVLENHDEHWGVLRLQASDPRWRVREAVAMALQEVGRKNRPLYLRLLQELAGGNLLEMRAAIAGVAEPDLLADEVVFEASLGLLADATRMVHDSADRRGEPVQVLRKALGYAWSVVVAAHPESGKSSIEPWFAIEDRDVRWVMKQNLRKKRLERMDPVWTAHWRAILDR
jgi:hypothetical protein